MFDPAEIAARAAPNAGVGLRQPALAVALSGGGYRAMLFHVGSLRRLNELGLLRVVSRFSSVSGGSVAAAVVALNWDKLDFDENGVGRSFHRVEAAVLHLARRTIDMASAVGSFLPGVSAAQLIARRYRCVLGNATLQDLPDVPRFTFNTTNFSTGVLVRWAKEYMADYRLGSVFSPDVRLADVVAASSAFPPFLSPMTMRMPGTLVHHDSRAPVPDAPSSLVLTDGGVYDNLGMEPIKSFHSTLVSDGGAPFGWAGRTRTNWFSQSLRTAGIINEQVRANRKRQLVRELTSGERLGALWTINTAMTRYPSVALPVDDAAVAELAAVPTRLARLPDCVQKRLVNWGYVQADAAIRSYVEPTCPPPSGYPHPNEALG